MPEPQAACEDEAREALAAAAGALCAGRGRPGAGGPASLSLRWRRSGGEGFLAVAASAWEPATDAEAVDWFTLEPSPGPESDGHLDDTAQSGSHLDRRLHRDLYRQLPETSAVVSWRPVFSTTLACLAAIQREGIPTFHPDVAVAAGGAIRCARKAAANSPALSDHVLAALQDRRACLLAGRGLLVIGRTLPAALGLSAEIESLAQIYCEVLRLSGRSSDSADSADDADSAAAGGAG